MRKYDIDRKILRSSIYNLEKLKASENKKERKNLAVVWRIPNTIDIENKLFEIIKKYREIEISISAHELILEAIRILPPLISNSYNVNMMCEYCFLKKKIFTIRNITHNDNQKKSKSLTEIF